MTSPWKSIKTVPRSKKYVAIVQPLLVKGSTGFEHIINDLDPDSSERVVLLYESPEISLFNICATPMLL